AAGAVGIRPARQQRLRRGANPRLRKIRDALDLLRLPTDELLHHGSPRLVYGVRLVENVREYLLGMERRPRYLLPQRKRGGRHAGDHSPLARALAAATHPA